MTHSLLALLGVVLLIYSALFVLGPIVNWFRLSFDPASRAAPRSTEMMPDAAQDAFRAAAPALASSGFVCCATAVRRDQPLGVWSYLAVWANRETGESAIIATVVAPMQTRILVGFESDFGESCRVETTNMKSANSFRPVPGVHGMSLSGLKDIALLLQIHRARAAHFKPPGVTPILPDPGTEFDRLREDFERAFREQVRTGLFRFDERRGRYRATFFGACTMTWGQIWPISLIRKSIRRRRVRRELAAIGFPNCRNE